MSRWASGSSITPPNYGNTISSKWHSASLALKRSPVSGSRYFIIDVEINSKALLRTQFCTVWRCNGTCIAQPKTQKWETLGGYPNTSCKRRDAWWVVGLIRINDAVCIMAWLQAKTHSFVFISKCLATTWVV